MGINNIDELKPSPEPPPCARCGDNEYAGFIKISYNGEERGVNLCSWCLPIMNAKLVGLMIDHVHNMDLNAKALIAERKTGAGLHD
jgi:hypothetical protein